MRCCTLYLAIVSRGSCEKYLTQADSARMYCAYVLRARVTLEEFALSTCVTVALHGVQRTASENTPRTGTDRLSTLIKSAAMLLLPAYHCPLVHGCLLRPGPSHTATSSGMLHILGIMSL